MLLKLLSLTRLKIIKFTIKFINTDKINFIHLQRIFDQENKDAIQIKVLSVDTTLLVLYHDHISQ